ncbi:MAG: TlyA family RNA methyltransferase [Spirochaetes bacterium]|nr:TlyA family RNA methyltransferase [Spirochaetota bacterium]
MSKKTRLDHYLLKLGLCDSIENAQKKIIAGWVIVNSGTVRDPAGMVSGTESIKIERPRGEFASRGGEKLRHALKQFKLSVDGKTAADLGASTGGFTDCMLKGGAKKVYAVDVGYGILDYGLRTDERVIVKERTNVKKLEKEDFTDKVEFITVDLSFISIISVFEKIYEIFSPAEGVILIKPQFEANPDELEKGVVTKKEDHRNILIRVIDKLLNMKMVFRGLCYSPITGPAGNIEFLLYFETGSDKHQDTDRIVIKNTIYDVIDEAYKNFSK